MIETDCPYLIPKNLPDKPKNNRNEPSNLNHIAREIAMLMEVDEEILRTKSFENTLNFFDIKTLL
jgi:TatD DNase family protein